MGSIAAGTASDGEGDLSDITSKVVGGNDDFIVNHYGASQEIFTNLVRDNEIVIFYRQTTDVSTDAGAEIVVDLPDGFNVGFECSVGVLPDLYYVNFGIGTVDMASYGKGTGGTNQGVKRQLLKAPKFSDRNSLLVENVEFDEIIPKVDLMGDLLKVNQPNGVYVMLAKGVQYKKPNPYGISFYLELSVTTFLDAQDTDPVDLWVNGVRLDRIIDVSWRLTDDTGRVREF
jgi:hypothetical protein